MDPSQPSSGSRPFLRRWEAFTLLETLLVLAVIAILFVLLAPAYQSVRENSKMAGCASNLRELGAAFSLYANDNNNSFPPGYAATGKVWVTYIIPYLPGVNPSLSNTIPNVLYCPSTSHDGIGMNRRDPVQWRTDYGSNANLYLDNVSRQRIGYSTKSILLYDGFGTGTATTPKQYLRHLGGLNCLFFDSHIEHLATLPSDISCWAKPK